MKHILRASVVLIAVNLSACATIVSGTSQPVMVNSEPSGANCVLSAGGMPVGQVASTPGVLQVSKSSNALQASCTKAGYAVAQQGMPAKTNGWIFGNIVFGGIIGVVVDFSNGAAYKYDDTMTVNLGQPSVAAAPAPHGLPTS